MDKYTIRGVVELLQLLAIAFFIIGGESIAEFIF